MGFFLILKFRALLLEFGCFLNLEILLLEFGDFPKILNLGNFLCRV